MAKGRPCKICKLKKSNPKAYKKISNQINRDEKGTTAKFLRELNEEYKLNIILMNVQRHKTHMDGNVTELKSESKSTVGQKRTVKTGALLINSPNTINFPDVDPKYIQFLINYRENGYRDKEGALKGTGLKRAKTAYDIMKRPEVQAALNEMKAIDFIELKVTGNQIISGLGKIAHHPEIKHLMYDEEGELITNIREWPEELRHALQGVEKELITTSDKDGNESTREKYKFKFESSLSAFKELRKHFMDVELYKRGEDKEEIYKQIIEKLISDQINPIAAGLEIDMLGRDVPEALKIIMRKDPGKDPETDDHGIGSRIKKRMDKLKNAD